MPRRARPVNDAGSAESPGYLVLGIRGGTTDIAVGRTSVSPFIGITNLLDAGYNASVVVNAFGGRFYEPGPGRALFAGVRVAVGGG